MLAKVEYFSELAERSAAQLTKSRENWTNYLDTAARLYKYPFDEQLMIHGKMLQMIIGNKIGTIVRFCCF